MIKTGYCKLGSRSMNPKSLNQTNTDGREHLIKLLRDKGGIPSCYKACGSILQVPCDMESPLSPNHTLLHCKKNKIVLATN